MGYDELLINTCDLVRPTFDLITNRRTGEVVTPGEKCRWMWGLRRVPVAVGEEILSVAKVFFRVTLVIDTEYFLRYEGAEYKVVKILKPQNSIFRHHVEVYVV